MCGRFALTATPEELAAMFALLDLGDIPARYNIAPTQPVTMVIAGPPRQPGSNLPDRQAMLVRWGLIPGWAKDPKTLPLLFNIRSETAAEKGTSRAAMRHRRTLVPATGFYEWRTVGKQKQAYFLKPRAGHLLAFAGLMETYADPNGSEIDTGAILTANASADLSFIHPRMPVVIAEQDFARWLDCRGREPRDVADLLRPAPVGTFEPIPVSDLVNKVANTGPELQDRIEPKPLTGPEPKAKEEEPADPQINLF